MTNEEVANILDEIADLLDIRGEMSFKVQAYHRAANSIRSLREDINVLYKEGNLREVPAVGKGIAEKIMELLETGSLPYYEDLKEEIPPSLVELMRIPGLGPKKAKFLYDTLSITTIDELLEAARTHRLRGLKGMSAKTEENIIRGIQQLRRARERILLFEAHPIAERFIKNLRRQDFVERADMAGSLRRMKETIGDIDLLAASYEPHKVMDYFCHMPEVAQVLMKGDTKSSIIARNGLQIDLRVVSPDQYGSALQYFTGSKEHNVHLREIARKKGLKINEYGIFEMEVDRRIGGEKEEEIYEVLGMPYIPPVLREDRGEIERGIEDSLPRLIQLEDVRGDLHVHSSWTDGLSKIKRIAEAAIELGYEYVAICDHAEQLKVAGGLTKKELRAQAEEIMRLNEELDGITIMCGIELNIDNDGRVDYEDEFLKELNIVVASIHGGFRQPEDQLTKRTLSAIYNEYIDIIGHPTGRILGKREPYAIDLKTIFKAAAETNTILELNSFPDRLDLNDIQLREAKEGYGIKFAINTDAHSAAQLAYIKYGVATAQRGWLEPEDVINTYPLDKLKEILK
ncbi:MAG: DNA polymerase/3'-5' exonuclease PolX [Actinomycetota bacterium]|nr:DNA polymerase/3'-5' exonuclease PolX [Actinomycetota bacterium]